MSGKKILVTGGAGYLGSILVPELLNRGHEVTVVDNFMFAQTSLSSQCIHPQFTLVNGDVRIPETMKGLLAKADVVIPLAAYVGAPICRKDPVGASSTNKDAILWMLKNLHADQQVIMPTTNSAYGSGGENNMCDENSPLSPISLYAKDKVEIEKALMDRTNSISYRLATVFGMSPRMRLDLLVNDFTYRAVNDRFIVLFEAHFKRNYIHVRDVTRAFVHAIDSFETLKNQIYNVGLSDANISKMELCMEIKKQVPDFCVQEAAVGKDPDQRNYIVSNAKIEKTGYKPVYTIEAGVRELIKGYQMIKNSKYGNV